MFDLNEPVVTALRDRLEAELPAAVAEVNAAVTDGITIEPPAQVLDYVPNLEELTVFPTVAIQDLPSRFEDDIGSSATGRHQLQIVTFVAVPELRALAWSLRRHARAVATVALAGRSLPPAGWGTTLERVDPGPTLSQEEGPRTWMSWVGVVINARTDEG